MSFAPFVAALLLVPSLSFLGIPAHAQEIEVGSSLICDTEEQAERFIALYNGDTRATITAVNAEMHDPTACGLATTAYVRGPQLATARNKESVRKHQAGLQSFRSMRRIEASRRNASALRLRFSQSFASLRQRLSQAKVRSTIQRRGSTTNPFVRSERLTISVSSCGKIFAKAF